MSDNKQTTTGNKTSNPTALQAMFTSSGKLTAFVFISIVSLLIVRFFTAPEIEQAERQALLNSFEQVLPSSQYDNNPLEDTLHITLPEYLKLLGSNNPVTVYRTYKNQQPAGVIFKTIAPSGYAGNIVLLMAVLPNGEISGVRVLKHSETPGLGDKIEILKSNWITAFNGRQLSNNESAWAVKKDRGEFDQFTGATITPRAVVKAVKNALVVVNDLGDALYE